MDGVSFRFDSLAAIDLPGSVGERLSRLHQAVRRQVPAVDRIAVALTESESGAIHTFVASDLTGPPLAHYRSTLDAAPALREVLELSRPRLVRDLGIYAEGEHEHTRWIRERGFRSSYTCPRPLRGGRTCLVFFNSLAVDPFDEAALDLLDLYARLAAALVAEEIETARTLLAALRSAHQMVHHRDPETGHHLERMARYVRLIGLELGRTGRYPELDDATLARLFALAPLHDLGKLAIPDGLLQKPERLSPEEYEVVKAHTLLGRQLIDTIVEHYGLGGLEGVGMLRQIATHHHETLDGLGYPDGLAGDRIPLAARIVAVADIFDALTSQRPYKPAWTNDEAFDALARMAGEKLDADCVAALAGNRPEVERIQREFADREQDLADVRRLPELGG